MHVPCLFGFQPVITLALIFKRRRFARITTAGDHVSTLSWVLEVPASLSVILATAKFQRDMR